MSRLRILEEKRRLPKSIPLEERERILELLRTMLQKHSEILLAIAYGSFLDSKIFRDIDIALYTGHKISYDEEPVYVDKVREELEREIKIPVDIQLLDYAPPAFRLKVLKGKLLLERVMGLRAVLRLHTAEELSALKFKALRHIDQK